MLNVNRIALKVIMGNPVATARRLGSLVHLRQFCYTCANFVTLAPILLHFRQFCYTSGSFVVYIGHVITMSRSRGQGHVVRVPWLGSRGQGHVVSLA